MERIEKLSQFLQQNPNDAFLIHALALEYLKLEDYKQALFNFETNKTLNPDYVGTYYHLGKLLEGLNRVKEATAVYELGITIAQKTNDRHAASELRAALDDLL